jgi:hypothetical protein
VQLANDRQHLLVAQNARRSAYLQLLRAMGLRLDTELALTDKLEFLPVDPVTLEQAKALAFKERPDYRAQQERESNARMAASATKLERLPSVAAFGDYGSNGTGLDNALPTRTYGISVKLPLFDGGRIDAPAWSGAARRRSPRRSAWRRAGSCVRNRWRTGRPNWLRSAVPRSCRASPGRPKARAPGWERRRPACRG